jgi:hypothetical protein
LHCAEPQSVSPPQRLPSGHVGAQDGVWHVPASQTPDAHAVPVVHGWPSAQLGEHPVPPAHWPSWQMPEAQSVPAPQAAPVSQLGEHAGAAHRPRRHACEPQS